MLMKKTLDFFKNLKNEDRIAVIHHTDPDGVCSGVIVSKTVEKLLGRKINLRLNQNSSELFLSEKTLETLKASSINKVIITDMGVDQDVAENKVTDIIDFAELLIIDHHKLYRDLNSDKITLIKPQMVDENADSAQYCAAKFCFDIVRQIVDASELDWVASIGVIGDCGYKTWKNFVDAVIIKYGIEPKDDPFQTELGQIAEIVSYNEAFNIDNVALAFDIVYNAASYKDVLHSELRKFKLEVEEEIKKWKAKLPDEAEFVEDKIFYFIKPKYPVKSNLCTVLSFDYPEKTIIIAQEMPSEEIMTVSARRRDSKVRVNDMLEQVTKGLERAGGGGHIPAAGGRFLKKDFEIFKKRVLEWH